MTQLGAPKTLIQRLSGLTDRQIRTIKLRQELTAGKRYDIMKRDGWTCRLCGMRGYGVKLHVDHKEALANGGDNSDDNLWTLCSRCNGGKGTKYL